MMPVFAGRPTECQSDDDCDNLAVAGGSYCWDHGGRP